MSDTTPTPTHLTADQLRDVAAASNAAIAAVRAYDRPAEEILAELRRKVQRWEANLSANADRYAGELAAESERNARTQLGVIEDVLDIIGR